MCSGVILLYGIPKVIIGENVTFLGAEENIKLNFFLIKVNYHLKTFV